MRIILFPFALLYGLVICIRNFLFNLRILPVESYKIPVISVGNLTVGGTGKTPLVEYLIRLLEDTYKVATLSRGYGRSSKGFLIANVLLHTAADVGDEALQYAKKFKKITVSVCENRRNGISLLSKLPNPPEVILMDDAFQHRYVKPGFSILLTDYFNLYTHDYLLPSGKLREPRSSARRADVIIVTKTDKIYSPITERTLIEDIKPRQHQKLFLSFITYDSLIGLNGEKLTLIKKYFTSILLFAGIANPYPLEAYLRDFAADFRSLIYRDHYQYTPEDLDHIREVYRSMMGVKKVIITTEKDFMRIDTPEFRKLFSGLPVYYIPIRVDFHRNAKLSFNQTILDYVAANR
jgi:tetraacyldisaccharide 4'-kinase